MPLDTVIVAAVNEPRIPTVSGLPDALYVFPVSDPRNGVVIENVVSALLVSSTIELSLKVTVKVYDCESNVKIVAFFGSMSADFGVI